MNEKFSMAGRVAIVTGASKGIGQAIAESLAEAGAEVVVSSRKQAAVDDVAKAINERGGKAHARACHMGDLAEIEALVAFALETCGGVDVVVNNAAANPVFGPVLDVPEGAFDKLMQVNVKGPFWLARCCHESMAARGHGSVINISSIGGVSPEPLIGMYSVSKAALVSLTKVMAKEWGADGIRANVICPGLIKTKFSQALWQNEDILEHTVSGQPIGRIGAPEEVAPLALFLASAASSYCTGAVYMVDGGHVI